MRKITILIAGLVVLLGLASGTAAAQPGAQPAARTATEPELIAYTASEMTFGSTTELTGVLTVPEGAPPVIIGQVAARVPLDWDWAQAGEVPEVVEPGQTVRIPFTITAPPDGQDGSVEVGVGVLYYQDSGKYSVEATTEIYVYHGVA